PVDEGDLDFESGIAAAVQDFAGVNVLDGRHDVIPPGVRSKVVQPGIMDTPAPEHFKSDARWEEKGRKVPAGVRAWSRVGVKDPGASSVRREEIERLAGTLSAGRGHRALRSARAGGVAQH